MSAHRCVDIIAISLGQTFRKERGVCAFMFLFPFWVNAQNRMLDDGYRITLPQFPKDSLFADTDTIPPIPPDTLLLGHTLEHMVDSLSASAVDTFPNGEIRIDYSRIPPKVFALLALKYGPQQQSRRDYTQLNNYFKRISPYMQGNPNSNITLGSLLQLFGSPRPSKEERTKQMILQSY